MMKSSKKKTFKSEISLQEDRFCEKLSSSVGSIPHLCRVTCCPVLKVDAPPTVDSFDFEDTTVEQITDIINNMKKNKNPCCNSISVHDQLEFAS